MEIQRWGIGDTSMEPHDWGEYVTYDDAQRAIAELEAEHARAWERATFDAYAYGEGQRDERARIRAAVVDPSMPSVTEIDGSLMVPLSAVLAVIDAGGDPQDSCEAGRCPVCDADPPNAAAMDTAEAAWS